MKHLLATTLATSLAFSSVAIAGGPVVIEDVEVVAEESTSIGILPIIIVGIALCAVICGSDDEDRPVYDEDIPIDWDNLDGF